MPIQKAVEKYLDRAVALSRYLKEHPELPDQEFASSKAIVEILQEAGFQITYPFAGYGTAFHALFGSGV